VNFSDPIGSRFVASLSQPGGNITGFLTFEFSIGGKWLELLKEIAARVTKVAVIFNPNTAPYAELFVKSLKVAAASFGSGRRMAGPCSCARTCSMQARRRAGLRSCPAQPPAE